MMHVRYCECDECLPGSPLDGAGVVRSDEEAARIEAASAYVPSDKERRSAQNQRAYMARKLREL